MRLGAVAGSASPARLRKAANGVIVELTGAIASGINLVVP